MIVYELSVHGFTEGDPDIDPGNHGKFKGITERIQEGYFDQLGVNTLALMPLAEVPSPQAPDSLGYDPSLFFTTERDFGDPDDLRELVDTAHQRGLVVVFDQVFNHTSSSFNPLWQLILEHPDEASTGDGGLYFSGTTPWGNRVATEKEDVQNMLIDACRLMLVEYHVDGFRFDATHSSYMDHGFLTRLAAELKADKPNVLLIAENLPNEPDLNLRGFDGFAQWCDPFHDKLKALLREGDFGSQANTPEGLGDIFYFSKGSFASHTNNVVNYCYSHDENSVAAEIAHVPWLNNPAAKERKGRLGLFATLAALGQPMLYMGQEFNNEQVRNIVTVEWPADLEAFGFFQWARRLIALRRRYPGLRLFGYDPTGAGQFTWLLGPWLAWNRGGRRRVVGWRARPNEQPHDTLVVMLNFEPYPVEGGGGGGHPPGGGARPPPPPDHPNPPPPPPTPRRPPRSGHHQPHHLRGRHPAARQQLRGRSHRDPHARRQLRRVRAARLQRLHLQVGSAVAQPAPPIVTVRQPGSCSTPSNRSSVQASRPGISGESSATIEM